ncbi:MAG TPA: SDR family oxidoreductase [Chlorobaculum parvum]|uniref:Divinyl chlorophyllide a 8-vinyl-reductase, chloroplastic n=1 Tax=Chlorobaculum parvum TaxID=274539 RepID=A0A7C5HPI4_9CHLB|nr:SDR family oxidoreductase [Chlorobaculum parvum]
MKKVLVAGSTGYIGSYVVQEFRKRGYWVRALVRDAKKAKKPGKHLEPAVAGLADEIVVAEATKPQTLAGVCDGVEIVFSSLGMTRPDFVHSSFDVDYKANLNILREAQKAKVRKFVYVSVFNADKMMEIENIQAHEKFVDELHASGLEYAVVRPTGYFSDMAQFLSMARNGIMLSLGDGERKSNPIHGADLAKVCVDAAEGNTTSIDVGGPEIFTYREVTKMAANVIKKSPFTISIPVWVADGLTAVTGLINRDIHEIALFASTVSKNDMVGPQYGTHKLQSFFEQMAAKGH